jgi:hypothetical protein
MTLPPTATEVAEWAAAALCNLSLCSEDSRENLVRADGLEMVVAAVLRLLPDSWHRDAAAGKHSAPVVTQQTVEALSWIPNKHAELLGELLASTLCNLAAGSVERAARLVDCHGLVALVGMLYAGSVQLVLGAMLTLRNVAAGCRAHASAVGWSGAVERGVGCLDGPAATALSFLGKRGAGASAVAVGAAELLQVLSTSGDPTVSGRISRAGGVPALLKLLPSPESSTAQDHIVAAVSKGGLANLTSEDPAHPPDAAAAAAEGALQALGVDVHTARMVLEGLAGSVERVVAVYEDRLAGASTHLAKLQDENLLLVQARDTLQVERDSLQKERDFAIAHGGAVLADKAGDDSLASLAMGRPQSAAARMAMGSGGESGDVVDSPRMDTLEEVRPASAGPRSTGGGLDPEVMEWLLKLNLGRYAARLASECGVQSMVQLLALRVQDLRRCGLKVLEERRFMRAISDSRGGKERGTSAGVKDGSSESDKEKG